MRANHGLGMVGENPLPRPLAWSGPVKPLSAFGWEFLQKARLGRI